MDPVVLVGVVAVVLIIVERVMPGVQQPNVPAWWWRVAALNVAQICVVYLGAVSWDRWLPHWQLWSAQPLGPVGSALLGYFVITFVYYWWHRARHEVPFLWRWFHQVHHSPSRIEVITSFYKHPFELVVNGVLSSSVLHVVVGLPATGVTTVVIVTGVAELIYHWNVRTPYWLGFVFQRPESHRRHHERGHHTSNFSDLPLWDMLFGTFDNPRRNPSECGFAGQRETQLLRMLSGRSPL
jgi:sterol desaturase/sphingolipid hydroxylase (fatty acid hydroxylase superfamily)